MQLIGDLEKSRKASLDEAALAQVFEFQRKAQWRLDFVNAENSMGFHAPQESARVLGEIIDYSRQGHVALWRLARGVRKSNKSSFATCLTVSSLSDSATESPDDNGPPYWLRNHREPSGLGPFSFHHSLLWILPQSFLQAAAIWASLLNKFHVFSLAFASVYCR